MHSLATRKVGPSAADDIVSEAFLLAWNKKVHQLGPVKARGWLIVTVGNLCRNLVRFTLRGDKKNQVFALNSLDRIPESVSPTQAFSDAWDQLSPSDQQILALVFWEELTHRNAVSSSVQAKELCACDYPERKLDSGNT